MPRNYDEDPEWGDDYVDLHTIIEQLTLGDYLEDGEDMEIENEEQ